jgi:uncharacterized protein (DUF302 family)
MDTRLSLIIGVVLIAAMVSCKNSKNESEQASVPVSILEQVDLLNGKLKEAVSDFELIASLDHHRMAEEEGAYTPPAIAMIFSDSETNAALLTNENQLVGLDLPFKVLSYSEADTSKASLAFTSGAFISRRHGIPLSQLSRYIEQLDKVLGSLDKSVISTTNLDSVNTGYGIVNIRSDYDFETSVGNLVDIVNSQSDTRWFGEIDFQKEALNQGKSLNPTKILFFGGPAPGAKAMQTTPKIGLDAFCQKLLVYENDKGEVWIAFNDIVAFSNLYYGHSTKPQDMINQRLIGTFSKAIKKMDQQ